MIGLASYSSNRLKFLLISRSIRYCATKRGSISRSIESYRDFPLQSFVDGVEVYKNVYGDPWVGNNFKFPKNDRRIPPKLRDMPIGSMIQRFRYIMKKTSVRNAINESIQGKRLYELGFILSSLEQKSLVVLNSFIIFKEIYGHLKIHRDFIIPETETIDINGQVEPNPWPRAAWGSQFGRIADTIKDLNRYPGIHGYLNVLGFSFTKVIRCWGIDNILNALKVYKSIYGDVKVKPDFIVPKDDKYPVEIHGMNLGVLMIHIRYNTSHYAYVRVAEESKVDFDYPRKKFDRVIVPLEN
jgi:hypothetical protein